MMRLERIVEQSPEPILLPVVATASKTRPEHIRRLILEILRTTPIRITKSDEAQPDA